MMLLNYGTVLMWWKFAQHTLFFQFPENSEQIVAALYDSIFDCGGFVKDAPPVVEVFEHYNEITFYWEHNAC
jgi:hypothetical protein